MSGQCLLVLSGLACKGIVDIFDVDGFRFDVILLSGCEREVVNVTGKFRLGSSVGVGWKVSVLMSGIVYIDSNCRCP